MSSADPEKGCSVTWDATELLCCPGSESNDQCPQAAYVRDWDYDFQWSPPPVASPLPHRRRAFGRERDRERVARRTCAGECFKWFSRCTGADPLSRPPKPESSGTKSRHNWELCWLQWMAMTSSVPCHALRSPQSVAEPPFQPLDLPSDLFRSVHRSCLCMLG